MRSVKDKTELHKQAMADGATVVDGKGKKFNATGVRAKPQPRLEPTPESEKPPKPAMPAPPREDPAVRALAESVSDSARANLLLLAELKDQIAAAQSTASIEQTVITAWDFKVIRDNKGYMTDIRAEAYSYGQPLNTQTRN